MIRHVMTYFVWGGVLLLTVGAREAWSEESAESFEQPTSLGRWAADSEGQVARSSRHYKHGAHSMVWNWHAGDMLRVREPRGLVQATASRNGGITGWIYNEAPVDGQLRFQFGSVAEFEEGSARYEFEFGLDYSGWRAFWLRFRDDMDSSDGSGRRDASVDGMRILAPKVGRGTLYFDLIEFKEEVPWFRSADWQVPKVHRDARSDWQESLAWSRVRPPTPSCTDLPPSDRDAFATILRRYEDWVLGVDPRDSSPLMQVRVAALRGAIARAHRYADTLGIERRDGTIVGRPLFASRSPRTPKFCRDVFQQCMVPLAVDYRLFGTAEAKEKLLDLFDYVHDQGWAAGSGLGTMDHETLRSAGYMHAVILLRQQLRAAGRLDRELETMRWYTDFGEIFVPPRHPGVNADKGRTHLLHRLLLILMMDDTAEKRQAMDAYLNWANNAMRVAPGWADTIKPDFTGYHHRGIYANAYAPHAFHNFALVCFLLRDTPWALSDRSRENVRQTLLTARVLSNKYHVPVSISGRMPFSAAITNRILPAYAYMAFCDAPVDREMAAAFMRLWDPSAAEIRDLLIPSCGAAIMYHDSLGSLAVMEDLAARGIEPEPSPSGHWTQPYGALSVHRRQEWMAAIKGFSRYVWDAEYHADENVFGRYASYGAVQILGGGDPVTQEASGFDAAGWNWNRWPGTTTIHLPLDELRGDKSQARAFSDETFVGGVSYRRLHGVFAMKLHDTMHHPSFRAHKSVFCFDDRLVCLGSDIQNDEPTHPTETTLFQVALEEIETPRPVRSVRLRDSNGLLLGDPVGKWYFLPNDGKLRLEEGEQRSIDDTGRRATTGYFATAWLDHGTAPSGGRYHYVVLPASDQATARRFASGPPYRVLRQDATAHIVRDEPTGITAYAMYRAHAPVADGLLVSVDLPCLVMIGPGQSRESCHVSVAQPDLAWSDRHFATIGELRDEHVYQASRVVNTTITLRGKWRIAGTIPDGIVVAQGSADATRITIPGRDGATVEFNLHSDH